MANKNNEDIYCSFCGKPQEMAGRLIAGNGVYICDRCVELCMNILRESGELERENENKLSKSGEPQTPELSVDELLKPKEIKTILDEYVIGQDHAKVTLSVAVYNHYKRAFSNDDSVDFAKSNVLLLGPTGVGKTLLAQTLAKALDVPFAIADATTLTEAGYVGEDVENILLKLIQAADFDIEKAEHGIIYIDEIDKIAGRNNTSGADVSREGVQRDILPIVEGATVKTKYGQMKTDHILFIAAGAFHVSKPSDLIPELQGRFPVRVELSSLTKEDLSKILTEPRQALIRQYESLLETEGVTITFTESSLDAIAEIATHVNEETEDIGARRLYTILERVLEDISFEAPDLEDKNVTIDGDYIREKMGRITQDIDVSNYIL